jgi:hypothetical protein
LPSTDSILDLDVGSLLKPDYIDHHIQWSKAVSEALVGLRGLCVDISAELIGDDTEQVEEFEKTLMMAAQHAKQRPAMRTRFEWLSAVRDLLQRHVGFFNHGGELYAGHETLRLGYTQSAFRRIAVSYSSFMWLIGYHMEERLDDTVQDDAMVASHQWLRKEGWQVRLADDGPEFVAVSSDKFFGASKKAAPAGWKVHMLELNSDILDASKKVVLGSLTAGRQTAPTEESRVQWLEVLRDLGRFMELRSKVLAWRPISKNPQKVKKAPLPPGLQDDWGAPPVVMWCAPLNAKQAQPASKKPRHQMKESAGTGSASWSSSASSWSTWWGR